MTIPSFLRIKLSFFLVLILFATLSGCTSFKKKITAKALDVGVNLTIDDLMKASFNIPHARIAKESIPGQAFLFTQLTDGLSPESYKMLVTTSLLYMTYGLLVEEEDPRFSVELYKMGQAYGLRALRLNVKVKTYLDQGYRFSQPLQTIDELKKEKGTDDVDLKRDSKRIVDYAGEDDIEALFFTGCNMVLSLFVRSMQLGDMSATIDLADVMSLIKRVNEIDSEFFFGFGQLLVAGYKAFIPPVFDPEGGIENAEKAFRKTSLITNGNLLMVDYFKAKLLAPPKKDPALFDELVKRIMDADPGILEGGALLNAIAQEKTMYLKKQKKDFFP